MKNKLARLMGASLSDVVRLYVDGRIDAQTWSAPRFAGMEGLLQDAFETRYGLGAYQAKIDKTRKAFGFAPIYSK